MKPLNYNNNYNNRRETDNHKVAVVATVFFIIIYIITFLFFICMSYIGAGLSGEPRPQNPFLDGFVPSALLAFIHSIIPFILSLIFSYKAEMRRLFKIDIILLVVHIIFMFM